MKKTTRKEQAAHTESSIIEATLSLLLECSFKDLQIKQICQRANTSIGGFYHHFTNKYSILQKIIENNHSCFLNYVNKTTEEASLNNVMIILNEFCILIENLGYELTLEIFIHNVIHSKDSIMMGNSRPFYQSIFQEISKLQQTNKISSTDKAEDIAKNIIIVFRGFVFEWGLAQNSYDLKQTIAYELKRYIDTYAL